VGQGLQGSRVRGSNISLAETRLRVCSGHRWSITGADHAGYGSSDTDSLGPIYAQQRQRPTSSRGEGIQVIDKSHRADNSILVYQQFTERTLIKDIHRIRNELGLPKVEDHLDALADLSEKTPELLVRLIEAEQALRVAYALLKLDSDQITFEQGKPLYQLKDIWLQRFTQETSQYNKVGEANRTRKKELSQTLKACLLLAYCEFCQNGTPRVGWQRLKTRARQIGAFNRVAKGELGLLTRARIEPLLKAFRENAPPHSIDQICSIYNLSMC